MLYCKDSRPARPYSHTGVQGVSSPATYLCKIFSGLLFGYFKVVVFVQFYFALFLAIVFIIKLHCFCHKNQSVGSELLKDTCLFKTFGWMVFLFFNCYIVFLYLVVWFGGEIAHSPVPFFQTSKFLFTYTILKYQPSFCPTRVPILKFMTILFLQTCHKWHSE